MPALRKPHRIAVLVPQLSAEGADAAYMAESALLVWMTCIEHLRRHPGLAVYDAESTPLFPRDGHFAPAHAVVGATPADKFFASTRRDELIWLELALPKGGVKLHALPRAGERKTFEALGRTLGDQLDHAFNSWLSARGLAASTRKLAPLTGEDVVATVRVIGPGLVEQARKWTAGLISLAPPPPTDDTDDIDAALDALVPTTERPKLTQQTIPRPKPARMLANRLPAALRVPALRTLQLVFEENLGEHLLKADPEHPQVLFAKLAPGKPNDAALVRRVIEASRGWARPYALLGRDASSLELLAGAGIAALCRPAQLDVIETAAARLADDGRTDEALRLMDRALVLHDGDPRAHVAMLALYRRSDRLGAWLAAAERAARLHGCAPDPALPRYPDQIQIDLVLSDALAEVGRRDEAIALRASRQGTPLSGDPHTVGRAAAREAWCRGDPARTLENFGKAEPESPVDLALFLDALVACGREDEVPLAWSRLRKPDACVRLAAARGLFAAGEWRRGLEELWRVELGEPGRDDHVAVAHIGLLLSIMPLEAAESALAERVGSGAVTLARRMARDVADFIPGAAKSALVMRALGKPSNLELDPGTFAGFSCEPHTRAAVDALFAELEPDSESSEHRVAAAGRRAARRGTKADRPITVVIDPMVAADRLVNRWLEVVFCDGGEPIQLARGAIYVAAQALARYLVATTVVPTVNAGALRTVAAEALALVRVHRAHLNDTDIQALLGAIDPLLRKVDRWVGTRWLAAVERSCGIDERAAGDVAGFATKTGTVAARILGPEEAAVLAASVARLHRERPVGWESAVAAQASRLALHTGRAGTAEWADATMAQLEAKAIDREDAIDTLHNAAYLAEGTTAIPAMHLARVLFDAGRAPFALGVLVAGLPAATREQRAAALAAVADPWQAAIDIPLPFERASTGMFEALQKRDPARAEKLGRWAAALDPDNADVHRNIGLALAQQGKVVDALYHLTRGTREQATQVLAGVLFQNGKLAEALAVLDHASRWYTRADQWLGFGGIADAANDRVRTERAFKRAFELDPDAFDASQLEAYSRACSGLAKHDDAVRLAQKAFEKNTHSAAAMLFASTLEHAKARHPTTFVDSPLPLKPREPAFVALDNGDFAAAGAAIGDRDWRARRAAIAALRVREPSEAAVDVTPRARAASATILITTIGSLDRDAVLCRMAAFAIREQAFFARDPVPRLGERTVAAPTSRISDRIVVSGAKVARITEYVSLLRDLAALPPREALAQFDLDDAGYLEVAKAWAEALDADPALAADIAAGLAKR